METPITEADRRDALDLTTVRPQVEVRSARAGRADPPGVPVCRAPETRAESALVRLIATVGVIAIGTAVGAALVANQVEGWIVGLSVSLVCVILAAILWRSRRLVMSRPHGRGGAVSGSAQPGVARAARRSREADTADSAGSPGTAWIGLIARRRAGRASRAQVGAAGASGVAAWLGGAAPASR